MSYAEAAGEYEGSTARSSLDELVAHGDKDALFFRPRNAVDLASLIRVKPAKKSARPSVTCQTQGVSSKTASLADSTSSQEQENASDIVSARDTPSKLAGLKAASKTSSSSPTQAAHPRAGRLQSVQNTVSNASNARPPATSSVVQDKSSHIKLALTDAQSDLHTNAKPSASLPQEYTAVSKGAVSSIPPLVTQPSADKTSNFEPSSPNKCPQSAVLSTVQSCAPEAQQPTTHSLQGQTSSVPAADANPPRPKSPPAPSQPTAPTASDAQVSAPATSSGSAEQTPESLCKPMGMPEQGAPYPQPSRMYLPNTPMSQGLTTADFNMVTTPMPPQAPFFPTPPPGWAHGGIPVQPQGPYGMDWPPFNCPMPDGYPQHPMMPQPYMMFPRPGGQMGPDMCGPQQPMGPTPHPPNMPMQNGPYQIPPGQPMGPPPPPPPIHAAQGPMQQGAGHSTMGPPGTQVFTHSAQPMPPPQVFTHMAGQGQMQGPRGPPPREPPPRDQTIRVPTPRPPPRDSRNAGFAAPRPPPPPPESILRAAAAPQEPRSTSATRVPRPTQTPSPPAQFANRVAAPSPITPTHPAQPRTKAPPASPVRKVDVATQTEIPCQARTCRPA